MLRKILSDLFLRLPKSKELYSDALRHGSSLGGKYMALRKSQKKR